MPRESPFLVKLAAEERRILQERARKYTLPYRDVVRAKMILLAAQGMDNEAIAKELHLPRPKVSKWRQRFFYKRLAGLEDEPRRGRPSAFSPSTDR